MDIIDIDAMIEDAVLDGTDQRRHNHFPKTRKKWPCKGL
jgi:hypothetical protein